MKRLLCLVAGHKFELKLDRPDIKIYICGRCGEQKTDKVIGKSKEKTQPTQVETIIDLLRNGVTVSYRLLELPPYNMNHPPVQKALKRAKAQGLDVMDFPRINRETGKVYKVWRRVLTIENK